MNLSDQISSRHGKSQITTPGRKFSAYNRKIRSVEHVINLHHEMFVLMAVDFMRRKCKRRKIEISTCVEHSCYILQY